ncbi:MAG TPA: glycosyltransferase family 4 protein [Patescibacteria group bacterium]
MKVLFLSRFYYPHVGGVEKHLENLSYQLIVRGHSVSVISGKFTTNLKDIETFRGSKIYRFPYPKLKFLGLVWIWISLFKYRNLILKSDIVHCHDVFIWYLPFRFLFYKKPVYTTFHGYESYPIRISAKIIRRLSEKLSFGSICIGDFMKKWYGHNPNFVSYGAVDIKKFKPAKKNKYKYDAVFSSRLDEQTGITAYIDAVKIIRKRKRRFEFLILGDGKFKSLASLVGTSIGFVDNTENYLRESRFAFYSRYLAILEAFAAKKFVFAVYDNPIKSDYLKMTPFSKWIVIEKDPKKLAQQVKYYSKNLYKAKSRIENAYRWVKRQTWENLTDMYLDLWMIGK